MLNVIRIPLAFSSAFLLALSFGCAASKLQNANSSNAKPLRVPQSTSNRPKIIALGDSLTAGFGLAEKESYPYLLQEKLKADGYDYEVINAGVSGDTSAGGLERADWVLEQDNAKILVLELGANDMLRGIAVDRMKANLDKIIKRQKQKT